MRQRVAELIRLTAELRHGLERLAEELEARPSLVTHLAALQLRLGVQASDRLFDRLEATARLVAHEPDD